MFQIRKSVMPKLTGDFELNCLFVRPKNNHRTRKKQAMKLKFSEDDFFSISGTSERNHKKF